MTAKEYTDEDLGYPTDAHGIIPSFANRDEEAAFSETRDFTEFIGAEAHLVDVVLRDRVRAAGESQGVQGNDAGRERFAEN